MARALLSILLGIFALVAPAAQVRAADVPGPTVSACAAPHQAPITISGHGPGARLAERLQAGSRGLYEEVSLFTGARDCAPIRVDVTADLDAAARVLPAWHLPPWAAGAARPEDRHILLTIHSEGQRHDHVRVLKHELAHLSIASAAGGRRVPRWFDEGVARFVAGEHGAEDAKVLAEARVAGRKLSLDGVAASFPADKRGAALAYAMSGRAISLLDDVGGEGAVSRILARVREGAPFSRALKAETGLLPWQLSAEVKRSVDPVHAWFTVLSQLDWGLGGAGVLAMVAWVRVRRRRRRQLDQLAEEERREDEARTIPGLVWARWSQPRAHARRLGHGYVIRA